MSRLTSSLTKWHMALIGLVLIGVVLVAPALNVVFAVGGGSMEPTLPVGTRVIVVPTSDLHERDIIAFREPNSGRVTTHTFIGYDDEGNLRTKGDANSTPDVFWPPLTHDHVIGKVVAATFLFTPAYWSSYRGPATVVLLGLVIWLLRRPGSNRATEESSAEHESAPKPRMIQRFHR